MDLFPCHDHFVKIITRTTMPTTRSPTFQPTKKWIRVLAASAPIIPWLVQLVQPRWLRSPFTPRQLIYTHNSIPLIFAPWTLEHTSLPAVLSRAVQVAVFWNTLPCSVIYCYLLWAPVALVRTLVGYLLSRSVGWAYPSLFCHWALYETVEGFGPLLVAILFIPSTPVNHPVPEAQIGYMIAGLTFALALLDRAPWTYGVAVVCGSVLALGYHVVRLARQNPKHPMMLMHTNMPRS
ncbi:hypothetical protein BD779DRAFT_87443 [Infundibulicybe gibba]|nr:hypothetical protein BD779DRAFT_87443 [Infundibulicybe gibba]